jgi:hypothetical protein
VRYAAAAIGSEQEYEEEQRAIKFTAMRREAE